MFLHDTTDQEYLAMAYEDSIQDQCLTHAARQAQEKARLSDAFVSAAARGADATLGKTTVRGALYEVGCSQPELIDEVFYWAARQQANPALRAMVRAVADTYADINTTGAA